MSSNATTSRRGVEHPSRPLYDGSQASITSDVSGPSFRFGLERVRTVRKHGEQVAQQALAGAVERRDKREAEYRLAEQRAGGARAARLAAAAHTQSAAELVDHQIWIERTEQAQAAVAADLSREEQEVNRRRQALTAAARDRKALDRLEARQRAEFETGLARSEGKVLDEIGLNVFRGSAA
jgi:flagellar export protein FliJ